MKISRLMIMVRAIREELLHMLRPRRVARVSMDGQRVQMDTVRAAFTFGVLYLIILLIVSLAVSLDGFDLATSWTATLSCLSNIGPGMTPIIGPSGSFAVFSTRSKMLLCMTMLTGRLEIYPVLILFLPRTWNDHF